MNARTGIISGIIGVLIIILSIYFYDAAGNVVTPEDVAWGLGHLFRDIDRSDIILLRKAGLFGMAGGGSILLGGVVMIARRNK